MAQRLVLRARNGEFQLSDLKMFVERAQEAGITLKTMVPVETEMEEKGLTVFFGVPIPESAAVKVNGRRVRRVVKTKKEKEVEQQIEDHKKKIENKEEVLGYVEPVGGKKKPKKAKCPDCGWRKEVVTRNGKQVIKKHQTQGKICNGSDTPVAGKKT